MCLVAKWPGVAALSNALLHRHLPEQVIPQAANTGSMCIFPVVPNADFNQQGNI